MIARAEIQSFQHRPMDRFGLERIAAKQLSPYRLENQSRIIRVELIEG